MCGEGGGGGGLSHLRWQQGDSCATSTQLSPSCHRGWL